MSEVTWPARPTRRFLLLMVGLATAAAVTAGCASSTGSGAASSTADALTTAPVGSVTVAHTAAASTQASSAAPAGDGSFRMPNEVGKVLQTAQDDIQRVSKDPIFFSHSHDLAGSRHQILDSGWKVCTQNVPAGAKASATEHIDFGVVKIDESCP